MKKLIVANAETTKAAVKYVPRTEYANLYLDGIFGDLDILRRPRRPAREYTRHPASASDA